MRYNQPYGVSDPEAPYINGNPSTGTMGSIPPAASIEYPQREIANLIDDAGIIPDNADLRQLAKAIQSGKLIFATDTGSVNILGLNCAPTVLELRTGMVFITKAVATNTGPVVAIVNGISAPVVRASDQMDLLPFDVNAGQMVALAFDGAKFQLVWSANAAISGTGAGGALTANYEIYINSTTGDDSLYDGSQATVGTAGHGPFKTIQKGIDTASKLNANGYVITIHCANGTYVGGAVTNVTNGGLVLVGNPAAPSACVINGTVSVRGTGVNIFVDGFRVQNPPGGYCFVSQISSSLTFQNIEFGYASAAHNLCDTGQIAAQGNYSVVASAQVHISANFAVFVLSPNPSNVVTFGGGVSFPSGFANITGVSYLRGDARTTFVGGFTGPRFYATANAVISTGGQGVNWFPGTAPGSVSSGGQYV